MAAFPVEVVFGLYLGILTGIIPALIAWSLGFVFKYFTGVTIPGFGVVVLALAIAGINGGLLALTDRSLAQNASPLVVVVAIVIVLMLSLYAHAKGDAMGATFPKHVSLRGLRERTLSAEVVELVGGRGTVRVEVVAEVADMEGYPPVPAGIRAAIEEGDWRFPADLPLSELESRFAERLRTEFDLADVSVGIDERGQATVVAAPPLSGLSKRVPTGRRAVSVDALVPTGLARGDEVRLLTPAGTVEGTVLSARSGGTADATPAAGAGAKQSTDASPATDGTAETAGGEARPRAPTTTGGEGRVTVATTRAAAEQLLTVDGATVVVEARGTRREYELISLLRRAGKRFRKLAVREGGALDGTTLGAAGVRESYGVAVLAVRRPDGWVMAPRGSTTLSPGDEVFAVGTRENLEAFAGVVA